MIKTYHEAPKSIFKDVQKLTDGDYALVHLFEEDKEYLDLFKDAVASGRDVILDNSIFELGTAFSGERFAHWVRELSPTWYVVPDVLEDARATVFQFLDFCGNYGDLPGKKIGVVQGKSYNEAVWCYKQIEPLCDMVACSFDFSWWPEVDGRTPWESLALGRIRMLEDMLEDGVINTSKAHHLLGVAVPQEMKFYAAMGWNWIRSVDTSNPVVHGLKGIGYKHSGLMHKESEKLFTMINREVSDDELRLVKNNIQMFGRFCGHETMDSFVLSNRC